MKTNWPTKKLGEIAILNPKKSEVKDLQDDTLVSFVPMPAVDEYAQTITRRETKHFASVRKGYTYFKNDDVIFAKITPCMENGKVAIARDLENGVGFGSTEFHVLRPTDKITSEWIFHIVASSAFREEAENHMQGAAGQKRVPISFLAEYEIPLPPIAEQRKIVTRIEKQFVKIDEAAHLRAESEAATVALFPAALHEIFSGSESKGWDEKKFSEVVTIEAKKNTKGLPYVGMEDVESGTGKFLGSKEVRGVKSNTSYFNKDHVLYGKLRPYLNKFLMPDFEGHCSTEFLPLRPDTKFLNREWLIAWLRSDEIVAKINATGAGARMPRANMKEVAKFKIPLPSLAEQKETVKKLDALLEKVSALRELQRAQSADLKTLKQSILHEAFYCPSSMS